MIDGYPDLTVQAEKLTVAALLELQQTRALLAAYEQEPEDEVVSKFGYPEATWDLSILNPLDVIIFCYTLNELAG